MFKGPTITNYAQGTVESSVTLVSPSRHTHEVCHRVARRRQYHVTRTLQYTLRSMCFNGLVHPRTNQTRHPVLEPLFLGHPAHSLVVLSTELSRLTVVSIYSLLQDSDSDRTETSTLQWFEQQPSGFFAGGYSYCCVSRSLLFPPEESPNRFHLNRPHACII
jgi:hypothetical protein